MELYINDKTCHLMLCILAFGAMENMDVQEMNVKTMILKGMLEKEIYIEKHEWFTQQQIEHLAQKYFTCLYMV